MYCPHCGKLIQGGQKYCPECGKPVTAIPATPVPSASQGPPSPPYVPPSPPPTAGRRDLAWHIRLLGILWIIFGALRIVPALFFLSFTRVGIPFLPWQVRHWIGPALVPLGILFTASAVAGIIAGWGLLQRESWARVLALVLGVIALIHPPLGTALGIYTLWVLIPSHCEAEYRALSRPA